MVEYQVGGEKYQKTFTYAYFRETSSKSRQANVFDRTYVLEPAKSGFADDIPNRVSHDSLFIIQLTHRSVLSNDMPA